jgi:alpha-L-rhamnosidase
VCPWTVYEYYGDVRLLQECYPMMKRWVEYIRSQGKNELLWNTGFHYGDWLALDAGSDLYTGATSKDLIATAYYALSTRLTAKAAAALGMMADAEEYERLFRRICKAFGDEFVTRNGRLACPTQTAQVLGLRFNLLDKAAGLRAVDTLTTLINERDGHLSTGFIGTPHICHALTDNCRHQTACELVLKRDYPSWLYPITKGATTMWEHWDSIKADGSFWSPDMNSFNHYAYSSIGDWLYRHILGIAPDAGAPGFKNVLVKPKPCYHFTQASGSLVTLYGEIKVSWKLSSGQFEMDLSVPENTTATVELPGAREHFVKESGKPLIQAEGISGIKHVMGGVVFQAGSGKYKFLYAFENDVS